VILKANSSNLTLQHSTTTKKIIIHHTRTQINTDQKQKSKTNKKRKRKKKQKERLMPEKASQNTGNN